MKPNRFLKPWLALVIRSLLFLVFQALFALVFLLGGTTDPWNTSAAWWPFAIIVTDLACLGLLIRLYRQEGKNFWNVFRIERQFVKQDLLFMSGFLVIGGLLGYLPNILSARWLFGDPQVALDLLVRPLPAWAAITSFALFPLLQGLVEIPTYMLYAMPRLEAAGDASLAGGCAGEFLPVCPAHFCAFPARRSLHHLPPRDVPALCGFDRPGHARPSTLDAVYGCDPCHDGYVRGSHVLDQNSINPEHISHQKGPSMKIISPVKFTLATFAFTWSLLAIAILSGQSSKDFPNILYYMIGGCGPSLVAIFLVWRNFNTEQRREFWSRVFNPQRVKPFWWIVALVAVPAAMLLGVWVNSLLGGALPQMDYVYLLKAQPAEIPIFIIMMLIGGPLAEELGWRGLLLDSFQKKWSPVISTLVLFLIWWLWHLPLFFLPGTTQFGWGFFSSMFWLFTMNVFLLSILMTLAHNANQNSVLAAILIHFSYNVTLSLLVPYSVQAFAFMTTFLALLVVAIFVTRKYGSRKIQPVRSDE